MINLARWGFALALLPLAACQTTPGAPFAATVPTPQTLPTVSAQDQNFVTQAAESDQFEIQSSQIALQRSRNRRTRAYAQQMIDDHTQSSQRLAQLAQANGIPLPTGLGPDQERALAAIQNTQRIFDSEYFRQQAYGHQNAVAAYRTEINSGYNNDLKQFAQQTLPTIQHHLDEAESSRSMPMGRTPARSSVSP